MGNVTPPFWCTYAQDQSTTGALRIKGAFDRHLQGLCAVTDVFSLVRQISTVAPCALLRTLRCSEANW